MSLYGQAIFVYREIQSFRIGLPLIDFTPSRLISKNMYRPVSGFG
jgi:hypothetical protein